MATSNKCPTCKYVPVNQKEIDNGNIYECCRAIINKDNISHSIELCSINRNGKGVYPPGTKPETITEDPDALHELFCSKYLKEKEEKDGSSKK